MMHPFRWRDLPTLYRYRHQGLYLNSILLATRGPSLIPLMLFESLNPTNGLITWVCRERENPSAPGGTNHLHSRLSLC